jgi:hypothetical protein
MRMLRENFASLIVWLTAFEKLRAVHGKPRWDIATCRPKAMTTSIGSKSAAEPHERVAKESQLQRESI